MPRSLETRLGSVEARQKPAELASSYVVHGPEETADEAQARHLAQHLKDAARVLHTINTGVPRAPGLGARP
jgi:hypothetical protein